jgi:neutral trehalase
MDYVAQMALELGLKDKAAYWSERARELGSRIVSELWDERDHFFYDRHMDGTFSRVKAVSGFLPLLLKELPAAQTERLVQLLRDPDHFGTVYPVPSLAVSEPQWGTDMWRGPTWINLNYLIIKGLRLHGREEEADRLTDRSIELVDKYYRRYGVTFEYYDAKDERPPVACDRKGPVSERYDIRVKVDSIRDYHWTAALTACMLRQKYGV